jgi:hypothetical protein
MGFWWVVYYVFITGKHPGMVDEFMVAFVQELEKM